MVFSNSTPRPSACVLQHITHLVYKYICLILQVLRNSTPRSPATSCERDTQIYNSIYNTYVYKYIVCACSAVRKKVL